MLEMEERRGVEVGGKREERGERRGVETVLLNEGD